ncbi:MAG: hypothetical protein QNK04_02660 [Myxococcota bacterium]|nr:hypothetical protein [Myxococcota bacterium]
MGIEVRLTADGIGAVYRSFGLLTGQDLLDADARLREEIRRNPEIRYLLVDHSEVPAEKIESEAIHRVAADASKALELVREGVVAVVAPNEILFGLSRMWEILVEQPRLTTRVTRTRAEALAWLEEELGRRQLPFRPTDEPAPE